MNFSRSLVFVTSCVVALVARNSFAEATVAFSDGFDLGQALNGNWVVAQQPDTYVSLVDYSSFDLNALFGIGSGAQNFLPEAPHSAEVGGPATTGVVFAANKVNGVASAVNLISNSSFDAPRFTLQFDLWMSTDVEALVAQDSTEVGLWAVLLMTLWARSYSYHDILSGGIKHQCYLESANGQISLCSYAYLQPNWGYSCFTVVNMSRFEQSESVLDRETRDARWRIIVPSAIPIILVVIIAPLPWLHLRFSLRTLLIGITLAAVVLGLVITASSATNCAGPRHSPGAGAR